MTLVSRCRRVACRLAALILATLAAPAFAACGVATPQTDPLGSYSPATVRAGASGWIAASGGFGCSSSALLVLLSNNYLRATVASGSTLRLTSTTSSDVVTYALAADPAGAFPMTPGTPTYYIQNTTLNVAGLLGGNIADVPVYVKPTSTTAVAAGTYTGSVVIRWDWYFCQTLSLTGLCVLGPDQGSGNATLNFTLVVAPKPATVAITSSTTWDPVSTSTYPKAIPGSKLRMTLTVTNPDLVPLDGNTLVLALPTPPRLAVALDGDGTGSGAVVQTAQGTTPSTLTLSYASAGSTTDNVDFSSDGGTSWGFAPTAGDAVTQGAVNRVRFRPQGSMAPGSSFSISIPYSVR